MKRIIKLTESDLNLIVKKIINEQTVEAIVEKSYSDKNSDTFCKEQTGYDVCLREVSMDRSTLDRKYNNQKRILESKYSMTAESGLRKDPEGNYIRSSTWKIKS